MGVRFGDLEPRHMDRLRKSLAEVLAANVAYPSYFDYHTGRQRTRPTDRSKREEIDNYLRSVNFEPLQHVELTSPEIRRFLERLMLRYIEVNPALAQPRLARRLPELRSRVPRMAGEVHRGLLAAAEGNLSADSGSRHEPLSWSATSSAAASDRQRIQPRSAEERNTRVLEAILLRNELSGPLGSSSPLPPRNASAAASSGITSHTPSQERPASPVSERTATAAPPSWLVGAVDSGDLTVPVPTPGWSPAPAGSPFAGLESGAQSAVFGAINTVDDARSLPDRPTGPLPAVQGRAPVSGALSTASGTARELPPDLYQLYGDYLRDMEPEVEPPDAAILDRSSASAPAEAGPRHSEPAESTARAFSGPVSVPPQARNARDDDASRSDKLIFWQLRYQLEAYIRRATRSYGVRGASDDPFSMLDALRRSGFVDEADLRIAEGILALTDRVTATGDAATEDYRQALLLYLLYHRSHLGI